MDLNGPEWTQFPTSVREGQADVGNQIPLGPFRSRSDSSPVGVAMEPNGIRTDPKGLRSQHQSALPLRL